MAVSAWGLMYQEVIGLCWLAYAGQGTEGRWRFGRGAWNLTDVYSQGSFRAVRVISPQNKEILAFSGTDDILDWGDNIAQGVIGLSSQYIMARGLALLVRPDITVGHSLGGGLASYVSIQNFVNAATINPAPLHLAGFLGSNLIPKLLNNRRVKNYVVRGEALDILDNRVVTMDRVGEIINVDSRATGAIEKHLVPNLSLFVQPTRIN